MRRFETEKKNSYFRNIIISIVVFLIIFLCFWLAVSSVSARTAEQEQQTLETALSRGIAQCYAMEGYYPESLDYLKENYGLTYDEERFFIDYQPIGANILPDVTIIRKGDSK